MTLMQSKNTMRLVVAASCCAAVVVADSGDCVANSDACSCFDGTNANIVDWRGVVRFNTCCTECILPAAVADGCLDDNTCGYDKAKAVFEACGAKGWPATAPDGFQGPQSCEFFVPTAANIVNWRDTADAFCLSCVVGELPADSTQEASVEQTVAAFASCGSPAFPDLSTPEGQQAVAALVTPQSTIACTLPDSVTADEAIAEVVSWRTSTAIPADCGTCFLNRLRGGEFSFNTFLGAGGALGACGFQFVDELVDVGADGAKNAGFVPPGCGNFDIGDADDYVGITAWTGIESDCEFCIDAWARGTVDPDMSGATTPYPGTCYPSGPNNLLPCNFANTRDGFNYCGTGGEWAGDLEDKVWPAAADLPEAIVTAADLI